eukprot:gene22576-29706_t
MTLYATRTGVVYANLNRQTSNTPRSKAVPPSTTGVVRSEAHADRLRVRGDQPPHHEGVTSGRMAVVAASATRVSPHTLEGVGPFGAVQPPCKIIIQGRKVDVTDAIKTYVEHKISHACAHQGKEMKEVDVTLTSRGHPESKGKKEMRVEVTIRTLHHGVVRVEDNEEHLFAAIDLVCDKVERKMQKLKEKAITKARWTGSRARPKGALSEEEVEYREYKATEAIEGKEIEKQFSELAKEYPEMIRRTKVVETTPMSVSDAVDAIEAVGHDFYVFEDSESGGALRVLYRRTADDGFGLLIPKARD